MDNKLYGKSDEELEKVVRERLETLYHPACTCRMAPQAEKGVVDSHLRVYGVAGLRVCDASAFPTLVSGHTVSCPSLLYESIIHVLSDRSCHCHGREAIRHVEKLTQCEGKSQHKAVSKDPFGKVQLLRYTSC